MIVGPYGGLIFFQPVPQGRIPSPTSAPRPTPRQAGAHVVAGERSATTGTGSGEDEIYDSSYPPRGHDRRRPTGFHSDLHEFQITPRNPRRWSPATTRCSVHAPRPRARPPASQSSCSTRLPRRSTSPPATSCSSGTAWTTSRSPASYQPGAPERTPITPGTTSTSTRCSRSVRRQPRHLVAQHERDLHHRAGLSLRGSWKAALLSSQHHSRNTLPEGYQSVEVRSQQHLCPRALSRRFPPLALSSPIDAAAQDQIHRLCPSAVFRRQVVPNNSY